MNHERNCTLDVILFSDLRQNRKQRRNTNENAQQSQPRFFELKRKAKEKLFRKNEE